MPLLDPEWGRRFLQRETEFVPAKSVPLPSERLLASTDEVLIPWFQMLDPLFKSGIYSEELIFNLDESSCSNFPEIPLTILQPTQETDITQSPTKKSAPASPPSRVPVMAPVHPTQTSIITVVRAIGTHTITVLVHKYVKTPLEYSPYESSNLKFYGCPGGKVTNSHFLTMFTTVILPEISKFVQTLAVGRKRALLFMDGSGTHIQQPVLDAAKAARVDVCFFPPHATHILQPLDKYIFATLKNGLGSSIPPGPLPTEKDKRSVFIRSFVQALQRSVLPDSISSSFADCGIWPFRPEVVIEDWEHKKSLTVTPPEPARKTRFTEVCGRLFSYDG